MEVVEIALDVLELELEPTMPLALVVSAAAHDYQHLGVSNAHLKAALIHTSALESLGAGASGRVPLCRPGGGRR